VGFEVVAKNVGFDDVGKNVGTFDVGDGFPVGRRVDGFLVVGLGDVGFDVEGSCADGWDVGFEVVANNVGFDEVGKNVGTFDVGDEGGHVKLVCVALRCRNAFAIR